jgi:1-aminocyclopropane-1-carboxylate deaminase/D-cysteine desulfhydrase-like pyridoxal-dependent ACC family enzyme
MSFATVAAVAAPFVMGGISKIMNNKKARQMNNDIQAAQGVINNILDSRADVYDASGKIRDMKDDVDQLKSLVKNPYANLGVATQAAEMQAEETDIALASTLDAMRSGGMGAGGATALAQAAAKSKQGISANIEQQEAKNEALRAQGEQQANQQLMALENQKINLEGQAISAEERAAAGEDARVQAQLDRAYGESDFLRSRQMGIEDAGDAAMMAGISGSVSVLGSVAANGGFNSK